MEQRAVLPATTENNFTGNEAGTTKGKNKVSSGVNDTLHYTGTNPYQKFIEEVDSHLRLIGTTQVKLAARMGMHSTVLNRKMSGKRGMPVSQIKELVKILVEWGGISDIGQIEALLKIRNLNLTIFTVEDWNSSPLCQLANAPLFASPSEIEPKLGKSDKDSNMVASALATNTKPPAPIPAKSVVKLSKPIVPPHNLPLTTKSSFIGRKRELAQLSYLLLASDGGVSETNLANSSNMLPVRLLTLTGPGGVGKTSLALQLGGELLTHFENGVYFVDLSDIRQPEQLMGAIARGLGLKELSGIAIEHTLKNHLKTRKLLLILDNFEQIIGAALQVNELLQVASGLKVIVTSREVLHLYDEQEYIIPLMSLPNLSTHRHSFHLQSYQPIREPSLHELAGYEAIALFVQRGKHAHRDFALTEENAKNVAEICVKLEGLPLAIEIAASRLKLFSPQKILTELNLVLELEDNIKNRPRRHQTLRDVINWSYNLLGNQEKQLFKRLAIFASGFTFEAVEHVCGDLVASTNSKKRHVLLYKLLRSLVDKNLVRVLLPAAASNSEAEETTGTRGESEGTETRFAILETIREYALELLEENGAEAVALQEKHAEYYLKLAEEAEPNLKSGGKQADWLNRLQICDNNFRVALQWSIDHENIEIANRLGGSLGLYWYIRGYFTEARNWLETIYGKNSENLPLSNSIFVAKMLYQLGRLESVQGDLDRALVLYSQVQSIYEEFNNLSGLAYTFLNIGNVYYRKFNYKQSSEYYRKAIHLATVTNEEDCHAKAVNNLGNIALQEQKYEEAQILITQAIEIETRLGNEVGVAGSFIRLAGIHMSFQRYEQAQDLCERAISISYRLESFNILPEALFRLAEILLHKKEYNEASECLKKAIILAEEQKKYRMLESASDLSALLAINKGVCELAIRIWFVRDELVKIKQLSFDEELSLSHLHIFNECNQQLTEKEIQDNFKISQNLLKKREKGDTFYYRELISLFLRCLQN